jgi:ElaB/YqjD/DUF883 family membrane-anchored ribosome-binding protein
MTAETPSAIEDLRAEVAETRERLGETVACLAAKADVKARAQHKAQEVRQSVTDSAQRGMRIARSTGEDAAHAATRPKVQVAVGATAVVLLGLLWWAARRGRAG